MLVLLASYSSLPLDWMPEQIRKQTTGKSSYIIRHRWEESSHIILPFLKECDYRRNYQSIMSGCTEITPVSLVNTGKDQCSLIPLRFEDYIFKSLSFHVEIPCCKLSLKASETVEYKDIMVFSLRLISKKSKNKLNSCLRPCSTLDFPLWNTLPLEKFHFRNYSSMVSDIEAVR